MEISGKTGPQQESCFRLDELFFSTTDHAGVIAAGNDVFVRVSGYSADELIGRPHNIIRHPDMPRVVFQLLWDYLLADKSVVAYVKNRAKSGAYYWVCALVAPISGGFLSIRLKPSTELFQQIQGLYAQLLVREKEIESQGGSRKAAIAVSRPLLDEAVRALGYPSYDELMCDLLVAEATSRTRQLTESPLARAGTQSTSGMSVGVAQMAADCGMLVQEISGMSRQLATLIELDHEMLADTQFMLGLGRGLRRLAINAQIRAAGLGENGAALRTVAEQIGGGARSISTEIDTMAGEMKRAARELKQAAFQIVTADLSLEMTSIFIGELAAAESNAGEAGRNIAQLAAVAGNNVRRACRQADTAARELSRLQRHFATFLQELRIMEILHVSGRIEAVRCAEGGSVLNILDQVRADTGTARERLSTLQGLATRASLRPPAADVIERNLASLLKVG
ncbi:MAG: hypothetical protein AMXMBFR13_16520 [Phycisphaerae bacterium]